MPESLKNFKAYLPFLYGIVFYALYSVFFSLNLDFYLIVSKGVQAGGLATLMYAFLKHFISSKGDLKNCISELLKGIISSKSISDVVSLITNLFSSPIDEDMMLEKIEQILRENTDVSEDVLTSVAMIIKKTINDKKN